MNFIAHSSLAIEQSTLNLEQVTAVISGKRVIAPPKDIVGVKNAYEIYEMNRILAKQTEEGKIQKVRIGRYWGYILAE